MGGTLGNVAAGSPYAPRGGVTGADTSVCEPPAGAAVLSAPAGGSMWKPHPAGTHTHWPGGPWALGKAGQQHPPWRCPAGPACMMIGSMKCCCCGCRCGSCCCPGSCCGPGCTPTGRNGGRAPFRGRRRVPEAVGHVRRLRRSSDDRNRRAAALQLARPHRWPASGLLGLGGAPVHTPRGSGSLLRQQPAASGQRLGGRRPGGRRPGGLRPGGRRPEAGRAHAGGRTARAPEARQRPASLSSRTCRPTAERPLDV